MNVTKRKAKISPAQHAARVASARRGTGPRTEEGKARASQNARTHGLCSLAPVLPGEDATEFERLLAQSLKDHQPATEEERRMVFEMCCASRAIDRVRKADAAAILIRMREAGEAFDKMRAESLKEPADLVLRGRHDLVAALLGRADGVRRLIEIWEHFAAELARAGFLNVGDRRIVATLLGCRYEDFNDETLREVHGLGMALEIQRGADTAEHAKLLKRGVVVDKDRPLERLTAIIAGELEALRSILPDLEAEESEQRQQAIEAALIDTSDDGARRHRYLQDHQRTFRQLSAALIACKTARLKLYGRILSSSAGEPPWTPPAEPVAAAPQAAPRNEPKNDPIPVPQTTSVETPAPAPARPMSRWFAALAPRRPTALPGLA